MKTSAPNELNTQPAKKAKTEDTWELTLLAKTSGLFKAARLPSFTAVTDKLKEDPVYEAYEVKRRNRQLIQIIRGSEDELEQVKRQLAWLQTFHQQTLNQLNQKEAQLAAARLENEELKEENQELNEENQKLFEENETLHYRNEGVYQQKFIFFANNASENKNNPQLDDFNQACALSFSD